MHCPTQASREATPSSDKEAPPDDVVRCTHGDVRSSNKRRNQRPLRTVTTAAVSHGDDHGWEASSSSMGRASAAVRSIKCWERTPTYHFKRLLEEVCPNHAYPVRHRLKDYDMMQSLMTSGSLTWGTEPDEGPEGSDATPFPEENAVMVVISGRPPSGRHRMSNLSPRVSTRGGWGHGGASV
jgi:hypothetical protein